MKTLALTTLLLASVAFAQDTMKDDAAAAKTDKPAKKPLDISKLPFSPDSIRQIMTYNMDKIQGCYEEMLAGTKKKIEGKLMTSFVITPEGVVKKAKIDKKQSTLKDPKLHECVVSAISTLDFPKPPDGADHPIEYPFNLKAVE